MKDSDKVSRIFATFFSVISHDGAMAVVGGGKRGDLDFWAVG